MEDISMSLTKADIVERIYKEAGFSKKEAAELVDLVFKVIKDTLCTEVRKLRFLVSETFQFETSQLVLGVILRQVTQ
jgi:nucleoid DNA-binding protein